MQFKKIALVSSNFCMNTAKNKSAKQKIILCSIKKK